MFLLKVKDFKATVQ